VCPENKYSGKYIATESFESKKVVASGTDIVEVYNDAKKKGVEEPVISYIPKKGTICIY
jgi:hypothetical protein